MNALDSPLEALAFNYLSYGLLTAVNNVWTWVALMAAAVSFWRIRASSEHPRGEILEETSLSRFISSPPVAEPAHQQQKVVSTSYNEPVQDISSPGPVQFFNVGLSSFTNIDKDTKGSMVDVGLGSFTCIEGSTNGKFTLYYCNEIESEKCGGNCYDGEVEENHNNNGDKIGEEWWSKWEMVMKMRKGDDEWYRYQDLTANNGNVVRLWDGGRRRRREATPLELVVVDDFAW